MFGIKLDIILSDFSLYTSPKMLEIAKAIAVLFGSSKTKTHLNLISAHYLSILLEVAKG